MWTQDSFPINSILKIYLSCIKSLSSPWGKFLGRVFFSLELLITVMAARSMKMFEVYFYWYLKISRGLYCKQGCINKYMCIFAIVVPDYLFSTALFTLPQLFSLETFQWCTISLLPLWKYSRYFWNIRKHLKNLICLLVDMKKYTFKNEHFFLLISNSSILLNWMTANHQSKQSLASYLNIWFTAIFFAVTGMLHLQRKLSGSLSLWHIN